MQHKKTHERPQVAKQQTTSDLDATVATSESQGGIIKKLTIAYANWEESAKLHEDELGTVADAEAFLGALGDSVTLGGADLDIFDRGKGYLAWLQGMALWKVRPLPGAKDKPMELRNPDGTLIAWSEWLQLLRHPMSESSAYWRRRIFQIFDGESAKTTGFTEMIAQLAPSYRKGLERDRAKWEKQNDFDNPPDPTPLPDENDSVSVNSVEATLNHIAGTLEQLKTVEDAPDLCKDVDESIRILSDQQKRIDGLRRVLDEVEHTLQVTYEKVVKYRDDGVRAGQRKSAQVRASKQIEEGN